MRQVGAGTTRGKLGIDPGVLELFRDEIVPGEAEIDSEYEGLSMPTRVWPGPPVARRRDPRLARAPEGMRVVYRRVLDGSLDEDDRIRHALRHLWNDVRASIPSKSQVEFIAPRMTHVDRPEGLEVICYTQGIVRAS